jgi:hypothetical protein
LRKSKTKVSVFSGWIRFSRDRVCTAARSVSTPSTYIVWIQWRIEPVWNFSATINT